MLLEFIVIKQETPKVLKSHRNVVHDLAFSSDGKYLISGSEDSTAKIWSVKQDFTLQDTIEFHKKQLHAVKIIEKDGNYFAVTAGSDNKVALYSMQTKKIIKFYRLNFKLTDLAISKKKYCIM